MHAVMCAHVCVRVCMHVVDVCSCVHSVCVHVVDVCSCVYECVYAYRGWSLCPLTALHTILREGLFLNMEFIDSARLAGE